MNWNMLLGGLGLILVAGALFIGFHWLDRWHAERAWRQAGEEAEREMRRRKEGKP